MPTGKVKWYDADKGYGFLTQDDGQDVYVPSSAVEGDAILKTGQRVEFGMAAGRRGPQALNVQILDFGPSIVQTAKAAAKKNRRPADELHGMIEDMIKILESTVQPELRRGKYPETKSCEKMASVLAAVAQELDPVVG